MSPDHPTESVQSGFREAMARLPGAVSIITTADHQGDWLGITVTSVVSVSMEPPSLLVCINNRSSIIAAIEAAGGFCVNLLARDNQHYCDAFADPAKKALRFQQGHWRQQGGFPFLADAQSVMLCRLSRKIVHATHSILIAEVDTVMTAEALRRPLIYFDRNYGTCEDLTPTSWSKATMHAEARA